MGTRGGSSRLAAKKAEQLFLKVSINVAPYLRKVDLRMYKGYM
jgi:hypothetical protein